MPPQKRPWGQVVDLTANDTDDEQPTPPKRHAPSSQTADHSSPLASSQPSRINTANNLNGASSGHEGQRGGSSQYPQVLSSSNSSNSLAETASQNSSVQELDYVDLTQEDDGPPKELYCILSKLDKSVSPKNLADKCHSDATIVGVRYYDGRATQGEVVLVERQPQNQYDANAIRIGNVLGEQIGHIPKTVAKKLAPYMVCWLSIHLGFTPTPLYPDPPSMAC